MSPEEVQDFFVAFLLMALVAAVVQAFRLMSDLRSPAEAELDRLPGCLTLLLGAFVAWWLFFVVWGNLALFVADVREGAA